MIDTVVLRNPNVSTLQINDLGIYLREGEETDLVLNFRDEDILESQELEAAMTAGATVTLNGSIEFTYTQTMDYFRKLSRYDKIDYAYISSKDDDTDITGAELEALTDGSDITSHTHDSRYYTQTELSSSGTSSVHWDNLTNVPALASVHWKSPVATKNDLPLTGNVLSDARIVQNDGDNKPAQYVCIATTGTLEEQWIKIADVDWGHASAIHSNAVGNLTSTNVQDALEELQGDIDVINGIFPTIDMDYVYNNGSTITVDTTDVIWNMSDGRDFSIRSDSGATEVFTVAASGAGDTVTINGSLDVNGGSFDISGTSNSFIHNTSSNLSIYTTTSGSITLNSAGSLTFKDQYLTSAISLSEPGTIALDDEFDATSIIGALNELKNNLSNVSVTLDDAYDGATSSGSGRTIIADSGAVIIDSTTSTNAPLELTNRITAPTTGLAIGQISIIDGELFVYDSTKTKWLSVSEDNYTWSANSAKGQYISIGNATGSSVGHRIPLNTTIIKVTVTESTGSNREFELRRNGVATSLKTFSLSGGVYTSTNDNIDLNANDLLQVYTSGAAGAPVQQLVINVYLKYRK